MCEISLEKFLKLSSSSKWEERFSFTLMKGEGDYSSDFENIKPNLFQFNVIKDYPVGGFIYDGDGIINIIIKVPNFDEIFWI